jgi:hypothetical protein
LYWLQEDRPVLRAQTPPPLNSGAVRGIGLAYTGAVICTGALY